MREREKGLSILDILLIVFIFLKILNLIKWSWIIVLIPLWIKIILFILKILINRSCYIYNRKYSKSIRIKW